MYITLFAVLFTGSIPGPIAIGALIDLTCDLWGEKCGTSTSCITYNTTEMRYNFVALPVIIRIVTVVLLVVGLFTYKPTDSCPSTETESSRIDSWGNPTENTERNSQGTTNDQQTVSDTKM